MPELVEDGQIDGREYRRAKATVASPSYPAVGMKSESRSMGKTRSPTISHRIAEGITKARRNEAHREDRDDEPDDHLDD